MKIRMWQKIICVVVALSFFIENVAYGLSPMPGSTQPGVQEKMYAGAQRSFTTKFGWDPSIDYNGYSSARFTGDEWLSDPDINNYREMIDSHDIRFVKADYDNPPKGWGNNPILKETDLIKAIELFVRTQAMIPAECLEVKEGYFPVNEFNGEIPISRIERVGDNKYVLIVHTKFVQMWNHIRNNDVWFEMDLMPGKSRTLSVAWGVFYRLIKHEVTDLRKETLLSKSIGHIGFTGAEIFVTGDNEITNKMAGDYWFPNDAIWMWFLESYSFCNVTRYDNEKFLDRMKWMFRKDVAEKFDFDKEFPNLISKEPHLLPVSMALAAAINYNFFNRPKNVNKPQGKRIEVPETENSEKFIKEWMEREDARTRAGITDKPMHATGHSGDDAAIAERPNVDPDIVEVSTLTEKVTAAVEANSSISKQEEQRIVKFWQEFIEGYAPNRTNISITELEKNIKAKVKKDGRKSNIVFSVGAISSIAIGGLAGILFHVFSKTNGFDWASGIIGIFAACAIGCPFLLKWEKNHKIGKAFVELLIYIKKVKDVQGIKEDVRSVSLPTLTREVTAAIRNVSNISDDMKDMLVSHWEDFVDSNFRGKDKVDIKAIEKAFSAYMAMYEDANGISNEFRNVFSTITALVAGIGTSVLIKKWSIELFAAVAAGILTYGFLTIFYYSSEEMKAIRTNLPSCFESVKVKLAKQKQPEAISKLVAATPELPKEEFAKKLFPALDRLASLTQTFGHDGKLTFMPREVAKEIRTLTAIIEKAAYAKSAVPLMDRVISALNGNQFKYIEISTLTELPSQRYPENTIYFSTPDGMDYDGIDIYAPLALAVRVRYESGILRFKKQHDKAIVFGFSREVFDPLLPPKAVLRHIIDMGNTAPSTAPFDHTIVIRYSEAERQREIDYLTKIVRSSDSVTEIGNAIRSLINVKAGQELIDEARSKWDSLREAERQREIDYLTKIVRSSDSVTEIGNAIRSLINVKAGQELIDEAMAKLEKLNRRDVAMPIELIDATVSSVIKEDQSVSKEDARKTIGQWENFILRNFEGKDKTSIASIRRILKKDIGNIVKYESVKQRVTALGWIAFPSIVASAAIAFLNMGTMSSCMAVSIIAVYLVSMACLLVTIPLLGTLEFNGDIIKSSEVLLKYVEKAEDRIPVEMKARESSEKHPFIKLISEYIVKNGLNEGPYTATLSLDEQRNIHETVNLLHEDHIEIFISQGAKLTKNMLDAIKDVGKREGKDCVTCRQYSDMPHLLTLLKSPAVGKRIIITDITNDEDKARLADLVRENQDLFIPTRLLNIAFPDTYSKMDENERTVFQSKVITIAILARLFEKGNTPMVEAILRQMLKDCFNLNSNDVKEYFDELGKPGDGQGLSREELVGRILVLIGKTINIAGRIGQEIHTMKTLWLYA